MTDVHQLSTTLSRREGDHVIVAVTGEIDNDTANAFREATLSLLTSTDRHLVLDFTDVAFCDSSGISALVALVRHLDDRTGRLAVAAGPANLTRALDMAGLARLIPTHPTVTDAVATRQETTQPN